MVEDDAQSPDVVPVRILRKRGILGLLQLIVGELWRDGVLLQLQHLLGVLHLVGSVNQNEGLTDVADLDLCIGLLVLLIICQDDRARGQLPMHDALPVRHRQAHDDLPHVVRGLLLGQRALLLDLLEERDGVSPLVHEVEEALVLEGVYELGDVGVLQAAKLPDVPVDLGHVRARHAGHPDLAADVLPGVKLGVHLSHLGPFPQDTLLGVSRAELLEGLHAKLHLLLPVLGAAL
mmetsp:Transcript_62122/g.182137  ORF Transcript_62122/g.182137 Transcript_62122/m.182137 type:complete len:234 (-) Transcript_62122:138-839(-)